ncbi:hypothetical protein W2_gp049 [Caulobacter phage W2]|uniref:Uncharacterized protein n=1 Tax=Caulobacter phage TMCBR4 TaxID=3028191 RepID=A0AAF0CI28_9CAUD|nr:hypothetical protein TMCBR4_gp050 [Caulobacter phage TMCBR4]WDS38417.1 hypothetical protein W2_gp049 [Caulobacter phage W2]
MTLELGTDQPVVIGWDLAGGASLALRQRADAFEHAMRFLTDEQQAEVRRLYTTTAMTPEAALAHVAYGRDWMTCAGVGRPTGIIGRDAVAYQIDGVTHTGAFAFEPWQQQAVEALKPNRKERRRAASRGRR